MSIPLYKQMMRLHVKGMMNYAFGSMFYIFLMFWLYPSIAENTKALNDLMKSMPAGLTSALNLEAGFASIESFISGEYYGLILPVIFSIFCVLLSGQLLARLVDQGSMTYLLSSPVTRGKVAFTQALVLVSGLLLITAVTTISGLLAYEWFIGEEYDFNAARFVQLNFSVFLLFFAIGGICFFVSAIVNDEKRALGISGLITFGFFSLDLLGKLSEKIEWLRNFTVFSLFDPSGIISGDEGFLWSAMLLLLIGFVFFGAGILVFKKRDLPL